MRHNLSVHSRFQRVAHIEGEMRESTVPLGRSQSSAGMWQISPDRSSPIGNNIPTDEDVQKEEAYLAKSPAKDSSVSHCSHLRVQMSFFLCPTVWLLLGLALTRAMAMIAELGHRRREPQRSVDWQRPDPSFHG